MLGWALKRGLQGATGTRNAPPAEDDTTQIEAPDTPAPVFAARAIKHAIFGTPAPSNNAATGLPHEVIKGDLEDVLSKDSRSPTKPSGILLTPGTATARRKRVSFGRDVKAGTNSDPQVLATKTNGGSAGKKSLQQRLEEARSNKSKKTAATVAAAGRHDIPNTVQESGMFEEAYDEEWEDDGCNHDVTVDLNEPHSRSGKYWKSEFSKYSGDARAEMEKLVKYKHLAKCYAQEKDAEAAELNQRLEEEHDKVEELELIVAALSAQTTGKRGQGPDGRDCTLAKKLADKTAIAKEYKDRVKELEALLAAQGVTDDKNASPRTAKTLLETSRELRHARNELKEMRRLREENEQLSADLALVDQKRARLKDGDERMSGDLSHSPRVQRLEKQLQDSKEEVKCKDDELKKLRKDFTTLKENAKSSRSQALQVLQEKNDKITELEKELKQRQNNEPLKLRSTGIDTALAEHHKITRDLRSDMISMNKPSIHEKAKLGYPKRSMSAEDLTLDFTQQSFLESPARQLASHRFPADLTDSVKDVKEQLMQERRERMEARNRDRDFATDYNKIPSSISATNGQTSRRSEALSASRRAMSDTFNEASMKDRVITSYPAGSDDKALVRGALDNLPNFRYPYRSRAARPPSLSIEVADFDLLQNGFGKLGGPNPSDTTLMANASRCTLPADRQAAARARLEQKRRERQRPSNKENRRP